MIDRAAIDIFCKRQQRLKSQLLLSPNMEHKNDEFTVPAGAWLRCKRLTNFLASNPVILATVSTLFCEHSAV